MVINSFLLVTLMCELGADIVRRNKLLTSKVCGERGTVTVIQELLGWVWSCGNEKKIKLCLVIIYDILLSQMFLRCRCHACKKWRW